MNIQMNHSAISGPEDLKSVHVTVMGLGRFGGGIAAVRYLVKQNAVVTVTDQLPESQLQESLQQIADLPLRNVFCGNHPAEAFEDCELLVVNPAVKPDHPVLQNCRAAGIPVVTEIQLLVLHLQSLSVQLQDTSAAADSSADHLDAGNSGGGITSGGLNTGEGNNAGVKIVAVTGSNGKSTTAALIHHFLKSDFESNNCEGETHESAVIDGDCSDGNPPVVNRKCWIGGNIGGSLLADIDRIRSCDVVVLELSSFQLHHLQNFEFAPDVAVLTGFSPNHLDWHPTLEHYQAAKQILFRRQSRQQTAVLPGSHITNGQRSFSPDHDDEDQPTWRIRCQELRFGIMDDGQDGVFWDENSLVVRRNGVEDAVRMSLPASLSGQHSLHNLTAAACAAVQVGADPIRFPKSVMKFRGLPYRLAVSGQKNTLQMVNDSASTTPESTVAAVQALRQRLDRQVPPRPAIGDSIATKSRLVVIVGGAEKGSNLTQLARQLTQHADHVVAIGAVADTLVKLLRSQPESRCETISAADDFPSAFGQAVELVASTGIVLLSPGCSSFGWFQDYVDRGQQFDLLVEQWIQR